jgi:fermentation-respiration switch protein FrsA (DUF1100 family)
VGALTVAALAIAVGGCGSGSTDSTRSATTTTSPSLTFYTPDGTLTSGAPGDILAQEQIPVADDLHGTGYRITYVSKTPSGDRVPVTGVVIVPATPKPAGGYPVVAWSHGTTGIGDTCAPSAYLPYSLLGGAPLLDAGYAIAATDYEGLGTPTEIHPYLVGAAEGHSVIDSVRAARHFGGGLRTVFWGWSQGGHAALFARGLQPAYAPELDVVGTVADAPVTNVGTFLGPGVTDPIVFPYTAEAILSWSVVYEEANLEDLVVVADAEKARLAQQACTGDIQNNVTRPLDQVFRSDPQNSTTWKEAVARNSAGVGDSRSPVMLTHGDKDTLVPSSGTVALFDAFCKAGVRTRFIRQPDGDHASAYLLTMADKQQWIFDRMNGVDPAPSDCPKH